MDFEALLTQMIMKLPRFVKRLIVGKSLKIDGQTLDLSMQFLIKLVKWAKQPPFETLPIEEARKISEEAAPIVGGKIRPLEKTEDHEIEVDDRKVPVRLYYPANKQGLLPILIYLHGGAGFLGSIGIYDALCSYFAEKGGCIVASVGYSLAPEHKFPASLNDSLSVFRWVVANADALKGDKNRIAVSGDSAGGNLAAALSQQLADLKEEQPKAQFLLYPSVDLFNRSPSRDLFNDVYIINDNLINYSIKLYVDDSQSCSDPRISPLLADDFSKVPPTWVFTSGFDPFRDEGQAYAAKVKAAGVASYYHCFSNLTHSFLNLIGIIPAAEEAVLVIAEQIHHFFYGTNHGK